jgi:CDP-glucose 4,6-dehydratase
VIEPSNPWQNRRVFLTGHTGFKGGWLALWLTHLGAEVRGYALDPVTTPNLFTTLRLHEKIDDLRGDIRNPTTLDRALLDFSPEVVFHLAAQPLVRASYADPITTYETNVLGTARVLDAVRRTPSVKAVVSVTTDKVYENREWTWPYRETDPLGGYDPYSSSKACAEIVSAAYRQSFFNPAGPSKVALATARAGNVIGGGDWSTDRLLPDLLRGFLSQTSVTIRNGHAIRPWQHVLEPLHGYLLLAEKLLSGDPKFAKAYNFGPSEADARPVAWIVEHMIRLWGEGASATFDNPDDPTLDNPEAGGPPSPHEATYLKLDSSRAHADLNWRPRLRLPSALTWLVDWHRAAETPGTDMQAVTLNQIRAYEALLDI